MKTATLALAGLLAAALSPARADLRVTSQMVIGGPDASQAKSAPGPTIRTTTFYKDMNEREETTMDMMGLFHSTEVTLTLCDKQQTITMDPALRLYTVEPIGGAPYQPPSRDAKTVAKEPKAGSGKMVTTFSVQDLGTEKLQDLDTRHSMITTRIQTSGCLGDADNTFKYEVWTAPKKIQHCPAQYAPTRTVAGPNGCSITYEAKGDTAAMEKAMGGMVVQQKFYLDGKTSMVRELREWSEAALDPALFAVPAGYKQVSRPEYDKAKADAMKSGMMRGVTATSPQPDGDNDGGNSSSGGNTVADEVAGTVSDAAKDAGDDAKNQVKDEIRKKIKLPRIKF